MSKTIEATYQIVTPMFLGDAGQKAVDIRPPSVKGALRFWWRALNWGTHAGAHPVDEPGALRALHAEEARLFGIAAGDENGGQGVFLLNVIPSRSAQIQRAETPFKDMSGSQLYLLGMGLGSFKGGNHTTRNALTSGEFSVRLKFRPGVSEADRRSVADALYLFGLLGAIGSRARHGMGSVALTAWQGDARHVPQDRQSYVAAIQSLLANVADSLPPFTAFSGQARIDVSAQDKDPLKLLTMVGSQQQLYRSFGQHGKVLGQPAERNFKGDHDLILAATKGEGITRAPARAVFGLPHNYFFSSIKGKADVDYAPDNKAGRRASPLLLHVHALGDGQRLAVHCLMPAQFLPAGAQIRIKSIWSVNVPVDVDWKVLHDYLDRFDGETIHVK
ncbi:MAG: type III-B CRISPR module RAMP protein Cmr1 [Oxalobacteraceae bacterium]|nr:type III-B CRISPR module RAMP protein Cmr1 [Oxalobacteraceae bacterium]